jgi:hypothetical protein
MFVRSDATQLADLVGRVDAGHLQIDIADRRPLTDAAAVHDAIGCSVRPFLFRRISDGATFRKTPPDGRVSLQMPPTFVATTSAMRFRGLPCDLSALVELDWGPTCDEVMSIAQW